MNDFCESYNLSSIIRSSILWGYLTHFPSQAPKNKKNPPRKKFLLFQEVELLSPNIKKVQETDTPEEIHYISGRGKS